MKRKKFTYRVLLAGILSGALALAACGQAGAGTGEAGTAGTGYRDPAVETEGEVLDWQGQYDLGIRLLEEGKYEEAIIAFTAAIEIDAKRPQTYMGRGDTYVAIAQEEMVGMEENAQLTADAAAAYQNAAADYVTVTELDSGIAEAYEKAAQTYIALDDMDAAIAILEQGVEETGDEGLAEYLEELRNGGQATVTAIGRIIYNPDEYQEQWESYKEIYESEDGSVYCAIYTFGVRFDSPVECMLNGEKIVIEEAVLMWEDEKISEVLLNFDTGEKGPLLNQTIEMTGEIMEQGEEEIEEERDEAGQIAGYCYAPNGGYGFFIESYSYFSRGREIGYENKGLS